MRSRATETEQLNPFDAQQLTEDLDQSGVFFWSGNAFELPLVSLARAR